jgi:general secretion pathway protein F
VVEPDLANSKQVFGRAATDSGKRAYRVRQAYKKDMVRRIGTREICRVACQLATLLRAGMPVVQALSALVEQLQSVPRRRVLSLGADSDPLAQTLADVRDSVNAGSSLADAMSKHDRVFSPLIVNMVAAGETSGTLEQVLLRVAQMLEKRTQLLSRVKSAVAYPLMMVVVAAAVVVFLLSYVVPSITQIFLEMNRTLPAPTRLLISVSSFMKTLLPLIAIFPFAVFFGIAAAYKTKEGRLFADRAKLKLPLFGALFVKVEIARLTRMLGMLLASGIPIVSALGIVRTVTQNTVIANALASVKEWVSKGDSVADAIKRTGLFPPVVFHIVATSQISANLEAGLIDIAEMYDSEVELSTKTLTSLLEPMILLVMGVIVGFIVLAVLLPIFEINQML